MRAVFGWICLAIMMMSPVAANAAPRFKPPVGFKLQRNGTLLHEASGMRFPQKVGGFTRVVDEALDLTGHDVVISYRKAISGQAVIARAALIHIVGMTPKEHFLGMKAIAGTYFYNFTLSDIELAGEGPFDPPGMKTGSGYQGRFRALHDGQPYELSLSTVNFGYWDARLTATYPQAVRDQAQADLNTLVVALLKTRPKKRDA